MRFFWQYYQHVPWVAFAVLVLAFVRTCGLRRRAQVVWGTALLLVCFKYVVYGRLGGDTIFPELPELLIVLWDWAYLAMLGLALLAPPCFFWRSKAKAWVLPAISAAVVGVGIWSGLRVPDVKEVELAYPDLPPALDGYRILQITDLHANCAARRWRTEAIVDKANALGPDLLCLTGDYVDGHPEICADFLEPITRLRARDGVWAVTGNHEYINRTNPAADWRKVYARWGIRFLANACVFPHAGLALGGTDDFEVHVPDRSRAFGQPPDVGRAFASATNGEFRVLMQHMPREAERNIREHGVRLQLSGHSHGGFMPGMRHFVAQVNAGFVSGLYRIGDGALYVSNGAGRWGGFPLRYFTPSEITLFTLKRSRPSYARCGLSGNYCRIWTSPRI